MKPLLQHLNLLDDSIAPPLPRLRLQHAALLAVMLYAFVFLLGATVDAVARHEALDTEAVRQALARQRSEFTVPQAPLPRQQADQREMNELKARQEALQALLQRLDQGGAGQVQGHADLLEALARRTPSQSSALWLTGLSLKVPSQELSLQGRMLDAASLPAYLRALEHEPLLQGRTFEQLHVARLSDGAGSRFTLGSVPASAKGAP
ncbi:MAG TPA: PilN domain-containing protein [Burkholderiaceae bacterium]|jgi:Tfp pilus assembly protein PilN